MTSPLTATPTDPQETDFHPGHTPILEPPEGPDSALACICGGLLDLTPGPKPAKMARYRLHLAEARRESTQN
ncbi:hypothetical protein [Streptomyces parvus]|uniref:hypothetical protein n=1 Tax=Streptomyces parvus TaxID=66428 RepID=UPI00210132D1|nr:hypothetical protein [Streptomyces parvus]MCQ1580412.1 hypothetical protein [Streptomyces parvus]